MTEVYAIVLFLFVLFLLLGTGVWVGLALMGVAWVGMELFTTRPVGDTMITTIWASSSSWTLTALPLFIWMGEILYRTRLSEDMFKGLSPWLAKMPGGLVHTNIVSCTIFAAVSGSSAATLTTVGKMAIPELRARKYPENMVIGTLAGAATLGLMIPPSIALIVYGVTVNESITKLFFAGVFPGFFSPPSKFQRPSFRFTRTMRGSFKINRLTWMSLDIKGKAREILLDENNILDGRTVF
jgi:TRAP-type mannitol/chloroaromatic compound transport system permease large subunit